MLEIDHVLRKLLLSESRVSAVLATALILEKYQHCITPLMQHCHIQNFKSYESDSIHIVTYINVNLLIWGKLM